MVAGGTELFYVSADALMAVTMQRDGGIGAPRRLFDRSPFLINDRFHSYSVSADEKWFLLIERDAGSVPPRQLNVIPNSQRDLKPRRRNSLTSIRLIRRRVLD